MPFELRSSLPNILPSNDVRVDDEKHRYNTYQGSSDVIEEKEYTLDKAPIQYVEEIVGVLDGSTHTFVEGTDYVLSNDSERIVWQDDPADRPDAGTIFEVTYVAESIISRYIDSSEEELETVEDEIGEIIEQKFVDTATGDNLDQIGELFGILGKRNGRNDEQYRIYLKSIVQSFISRGTVEGIKLAISAATDVPISDIEISEDFSDNSYEVIVVPNTPVTGSLLEEVAEIADPSGVKQDSTRFEVEPEEVQIAETIAFQVSQSIIEEFTVRDSLAIDPNSTTISDSFKSADSFEVNPNKFGVSDDVEIDDATNSSRGSADDDITVDDGTGTNSRDVNTALWEEQTETHEVEWDFFEWTELIDLVPTTSDTLFADDSTTIPAPKTTTDSTASNDSVTITFNTSSTTDSSLSDDTVTSSQQAVAWDLANWNENGFNWTKEHN